MTMKDVSRGDSRIIWIDWMRIIACFMVFVVHSTEPFYLGGDGAMILTETDAFWASFFDSLVRACVPLFIIASSYLQFPIRYSTQEFLKRRAIRILIPFIIWTIVYALTWGKPLENFKNLLLNFNYSAGHLWFVYMLIGLYLLMPMLSKWAENVEKKELQFYLAICLFSSLIPIIRDWVSNHATTVIYGPSGLPRQVLYPLWGEASWNSYGLFYYFSGFIGYLLLGLYFKKFVGELTWKNTLSIAIPCFAIGFTISFGGFLYRVFESAEGVFPVGGLVEKAVWWETTWCNDTIGVVLMTIAWILVFRKINAGGKLYNIIIIPISKASYCIYLMHLLVLVPVSGFIRNLLGSGYDGMLGIWTTPTEILLSSTVAFICSAIISIALKQIPFIGRYIG